MKITLKNVSNFDAFVDFIGECEGKIEAISETFNNKELVKLNVLKNCLDDPKEIAQVIGERTRSQVVQVIGRKIVLYKENKDHKKIVLPN